MWRQNGTLKESGRLRQVPEEEEGVRQVVALDGIQVCDKTIAPGHSWVPGSLPGPRQQKICVRVNVQYRLHGGATSRVH